MQVGQFLVSSCEDKDSFALMRGADFLRAEYSPRRFVTNSFQLSADMEQYRRAGWVSPVVAFELCGDNPLDVLKEDEGRLDVLDGLEYEGEEVAC